jgi:predicted nuclease of predicted toxin-antitoxin system
MNNLKFIVDECLGIMISDWLKENNYDVVSVYKEFPGINDDEVLSRAIESGRILITNDKGFGAMVNLNKIVHCGIILLRPQNMAFSNQLEILKNLFNKHYNDLSCNFIVVTEGNIRISKSILH